MYFRSVLFFLIFCRFVCLHFFFSLCLSSSMLWLVFACSYSLTFNLSVWQCFYLEYSRFFFFFWGGGGGVSWSSVFFGVPFCFCCWMADFSGFVTGLAVSGFCKVLMLLQISLFSCVNRYLHCLIYALVLADVSFLTLFGVAVFDVFQMEVCWANYSFFCFCTLPFVFASFALDRQMVDGMQDGLESVWTESQNLRHIEVTLCVGGFSVLVAGFSKLNVVCVCARALSGFSAWKDCRDVAQNSSVGVLLSAAFRTKSKGCKGQNAHNSKARAGSACRVFCLFAQFETRMDWTLWKERAFRMQNH